jgi:hypothetical protein
MILILHTLIHLLLLLLFVLPTLLIPINHDRVRGRMIREPEPELGWRRLNTSFGLTCAEGISLNFVNWSLAELKRSSAETKSRRKGG